MELQAIIFMVTFWAAVISLVVFCYQKMLRAGKISEEEGFPHDPVR